MKKLSTKVIWISILVIFTLSTNYKIMAQSFATTKLGAESTAHKIYHRKVEVAGHQIFYRESGPIDAPIILLLHGYPTSSHMFRNLIPILNQKYHIISPDLPGFGFSDSPERADFNYTFENLAIVMQKFIEKLNLKRFAVYVFDYGAPTGYRIMLNNPEKITGFISQNGNAYTEGLGPAWDAVKKYWKSNDNKDRDALRGFVKEQELKFQYFTGVDDPELIAPETYLLDQYFLDRPDSDEKQLDLLYDYQNNIALYPAFHQYFRKHQPKALIVWGNKDPYFLPAGAEAYRNDLSNADVKFYNTGHFALETHAMEIGQDILQFMETLPK
ncbi:alpha/beta hydrolase [Sphingobacterium sp. N143]|uniref:alpha/beta fold hydrolase n=1 Tax=Sphingobacterium sp. N143 TaxID=2746727 RepID=UPI002575DDA2|nr:alpha/beta hydrolase [Sphingobacterium sp. N143]MDM1295320.1 alpha/beta hydrolase [Sphingobacterium sp. N143]